MAEQIYSSESKRKGPRIKDGESKFSSTDFGPEKDNVPVDDDDTSRKRRLARGVSVSTKRLVIAIFAYYLCRGFFQCRLKLVYRPIRGNIKKHSRVPRFVSDSSASIKGKSAYMP